MPTLPIDVMRMRSVPVSVLVVAPVLKVIIVAAANPVALPPIPTILSVLVVAALSTPKFKLVSVKGGIARRFNFIVALVLVVAPVSAPKVMVFPSTRRCVEGLAVRSPRCPPRQMSIGLGGAPGGGGGGSGEPLVTSR